MRRVRVVFNSSVLGFLGSRYQGASLVSKHTMEAFANAYRRGLAGSGVFVPKIEPGPFLTRFRKNALKILQVTLAKTLGQSPHRAIYQKFRKDLKSPALPPPAPRPPKQ